jgi:hypothetical protein
VAPRHETFHYHGAHTPARMTAAEVATTQGFVIALFILLVCVPPCVIFDRTDWHRRR